MHVSYECRLERGPQMQGIILIKTLAQQTGLPSEYIESQLLALIKKRNIAPESIGLNCIREILSDLLMQTFDEFSQEPLLK